MNKWMSYCMHERMKDLQDKWMSKHVSVQKSGARASEWANEQASVRWIISDIMIL